MPVQCRIGILFRECDTKHTRLFVIAFGIIHSLRKHIHLYTLIHSLTHSLTRSLARWEIRGIRGPGYNVRNSTMYDLELSETTNVGPIEYGVLNRNWNANRPFSSFLLSTTILDSPLLPFRTIRYTRSSVSCKCSKKPPSLEESDHERAVHRCKPATKDCNFVVYIGVVDKQLGKPSDFRNRDKLL